MLTVAGIVVQPALGIVQTKELMPGLKETTGEEGLFGAVTFPDPDTTVQVPLPIALSVAEAAQTV